MREEIEKQVGAWGMEGGRHRTKGGKRLTGREVRSMEAKSTSASINFPP